MEYTEPQMRPPQEANSLLLRATEGCSYNRCNFCYVSRGYSFKAVSVEELDEWASWFRRYFPPDTPIYMTGSNPFALSTARLESYIEILRRHYPHFERVSMQSRIPDITHKSDEELVHLCALGLTHLYIGTENGNDEVLALMNKGHTSADTVRELKRLDAAGITYTNFYILGMGGKGKGIESGLATARMFNQVHPTRITTTGMTIFADTPLVDMAASGGFTEASEREKLEELRAFLTELDIDTYYDGIHYLNPAHFRFSVADRAKKRRVIEAIDKTLAAHTDEELEQMVGRSRMCSL